MSLKLSKCKKSNQFSWKVGLFSNKQAENVMPMNLIEIMKNVKNVYRRRANSHMAWRENSSHSTRRTVTQLELLDRVG